MKHFRAGAFRQDQLRQVLCSVTVRITDSNHGRRTANRGFDKNKSAFPVQVTVVCYVVKTDGVPCLRVYCLSLDVDHMSHIHQHISGTGALKAPAHPTDPHLDLTPRIRSAGKHEMDRKSRFSGRLESEHMEHAARCQSESCDLGLVGFGTIAVRVPHGRIGIVVPAQQKQIPFFRQPSVRVFSSPNE